MGARSSIYMIHEVLIPQWPPHPGSRAQQHGLCGLVSPWLFKYVMAGVNNTRDISCSWQRHTKHLIDVAHKAQLMSLLGGGGFLFPGGLPR